MHHSAPKIPLGMAVEDRFIILRMNEPHMLLPDVDLLENMAESAGVLSKEYNILLDFRGLNDLTHDVSESVGGLLRWGATAIATRAQQDVLARLGRRFRQPVPTLWVRSGSLPLSYDVFDAFVFDDENNDVRHWAFGLLPDAEDENDPYSIFDNPKVARARFEADEFLDEQEQADAIGYDADLSDLLRPPQFWDIEGYWDARVEVQSYFLQDFIDSHGRNSLLNEFVIQVHNKGMLLTPYHRYAYHRVRDEANDDVLIARPSVVARKTASLLKDELEELEHIFSDPEIKEQGVQEYLQRHPAIFSALGYSHVSWQVRLEKDDGTSLRPDFMLQPVGREWWDILELKRPVASPLTLGRRDSKRTAYAITELRAQLREYAAYFENEAWAKRIEEVYGIKCYRPRLIGVIGRSRPTEDERQVRRTMTQYEDATILTFDELLSIARSRLLI